MKKKKLFLVIIALFMVTSVFTGCSEDAEKSKATDFNYDRDITVAARDAASGTRGAFHEIMGIIQKEGDTEIDKLVTGALEFDTTDKVVTAVEGDKYGIGYISLGSVSSRIKAVSVDGVEPSVENVKSGEYKVSRPFILVTKGTETDLVKDFLSFVESKQGQDIAEEMNYISKIDEPAEYTSSGKSGTIKVAGSTSVTPLMEKWQEAYFKLNPDVVFEMQSNGSSQGITAAIDGSYDVGMSSRELKDDEASQLNRYVLAIDGIAVVVNNENPIDDLSSDVVTSIYTGEITKWPESK
jgi:phosphate transport system substrate-binding protein